MSAPLVLLHGFTGSPASWDGVLVRLPTREALRPALLGHGAAAEGVRTFDDEVARLAELLGPGPVHLAGYSLGARLALGLLARHPERVARATLLSAQPWLESDAERSERRASDARWGELLEACGLEAFVSAWEAQPLFLSQRSLPEACRAQKKKERLAHQPKALARSLRLLGLAEMPDYGALLARVEVPVTLLAGELDPKFRAIGERLVTRFPRARLRVLAGAGHDLLLERPDLVAVELEREF